MKTKTYTERYILEIEELKKVRQILTDDVDNLQEYIQKLEAKQKELLNALKGIIKKAEGK